MDRHHIKINSLTKISNIFSLFLKADASWMSEKAEPDLPQSPLRQDDPAIVLISKNLQNPGKEMQILGEEALEERLVKSPVFNRRLIIAWKERPEDGPSVAMHWPVNGFLFFVLFTTLRLGRKLKGLRVRGSLEMMLYAWSTMAPQSNVAVWFYFCAWPDCFRQYHWTLTSRAFLHNDFFFIQTLIS